MTAIAFGVVWVGYTVGIHGWATIKGYINGNGNRISYGDLVNPRGYDGPWGKTG